MCACVRVFQGQRHADAAGHVSHLKAGILQLLAAYDARYGRVDKSFPNVLALSAAVAALR
jgi:hypothetical protein